MRVVRWDRVASHAAIDPPSLMQSARVRNSAIERAADAGFPPTAGPPSGSNASGGGDGQRGTVAITPGGGDGQRSTVASTQGGGDGQRGTVADTQGGGDGPRDTVASTQGGGDGQRGTVANTQGGAGPRIPQLPHQCSCCTRWVDKDRLALTAVGSPSLCAICHAMWQVQGAVKDTRITVEKEAELLEHLFLAFELLRGR